MEEERAGETKAEEDEQPSYGWIMFWVSLVVIGIAIGVPVGVMSAMKLSEAAQTGDVFGSVNAVFAGLAFAGVIVTLWMQRDELRLQRRELRMQRDELRETRKQHEKMAEAQVSTERRLLLAAYLNAASTLREIDNSMLLNPMVSIKSMRQIDAWLFVQRLRDSVIELSDSLYGELTDGQQETEFNELVYSEACASLIHILIRCQRHLDHYFSTRQGIADIDPLIVAECVDEIVSVFDRIAEANKRVPDEIARFMAWASNVRTEYEQMKAEIELKGVSDSDAATAMKHFTCRRVETAIASLGSWCQFHERYNQVGFIDDDIVK